MHKKLAASLIAAFMLLTGCSPAPKAKEEEKITVNSADAISQDLAEKGWDVQTATASSFHLWEKLDPELLILAENVSDEVLIVGLFQNAEDARLAFSSLVPVNDESIVVDDHETWEQAAVPLEGDEGVWLFRQVDDAVFGACMKDGQKKSEFESLFNTFQSSSLNSETTVPESSSSKNEPSSNNPTAQDDTSAVSDPAKNAQTPSSANPQSGTNANECIGANDDTECDESIPDTPSAGIDPQSQSADPASDESESETGAAGENGQNDSSESVQP